MNYEEEALIPPLLSLIRHTFFAETMKKKVLPGNWLARFNDGRRRRHKSTTDSASDIEGCQSYFVAVMRLTIEFTVISDRTNSFSSLTSDFDGGKMCCCRSLIHSSSRGFWHSFVPWNNRIGNNAPKNAVGRPFSESA